LHDRDGAFAAVATTIARMIIDAVRTAPGSPAQNAYVERVIGSFRRECLDHVVVLSEAGLRHVLAAYGSYSRRSRTHLALAKDSPEPRMIQKTVGGSHRREIGSRRRASPQRARRRVATGPARASAARPSQCGVVCRQTSESRAHAIVVTVRGTKGNRVAAMPSPRSADAERHRPDLARDAYACADGLFDSDRSRT
jgi:hypothetical protein